MRNTGEQQIRAPRYSRYKVTFQIAVTEFTPKKKIAAIEIRMDSNIQWYKSRSGPTFLHGPDFADVGTWLSVYNNKRINIRKYERKQRKDWKSNHNMRWEMILSTSSNFSKFCVSNSSLTSGINAALIWYNLSHSIPLNHGWAWKWWNNNSQCGILTKQIWNFIWNTSTPLFHQRL